jgi:hypothetical protein
MLAEATFIAGPLLAGGIIALWSTTAAVATAAGLSLTGGLAFATSAAARSRGAHPQPSREPLTRGAGPRTVLLTSAAFGAAFGALDVALPAFARGHGSGAAAGALLSVLAAGIGTGSFLSGLRPWRAPPGRTAEAAGAALGGQLVAAADRPGSHARRRPGRSLNVSARPGPP